MSYETQRIVRAGGVSYMVLVNGTKVVLCRSTPTGYESVLELPAEQAEHLASAIGDAAIDAQQD